jgi:hypothetical protein
MFVSNSYNQSTLNYRCSLNIISARVRSKCYLYFEQLTILPFLFRSSRERELLVSTRLRPEIYTSAQCIIRLLGWKQQKGSGSRFYLISFSSLQVLKCSCSRQPRAQDQLGGTTSIGRFYSLPEHKTNAATSAGHSIKFNVLTSLQYICSRSPQNFLYLSLVPYFYHPQSVDILTEYFVVMCYFHTEYKQTLFLLISPEHKSYTI